MYKLKKEVSIAGAHCLTLNYDSKCSNLHGHNWKITIYLKSEKLNSQGMIIDFSHIKKFFKDNYDHKNLTVIFAEQNIYLNTTAENLSKFFLEELNAFIKKENKHAICYKIKIEESEGSIASYEVENESY